MSMIDKDLLMSKVTTPVDETLHLWLFRFQLAAYCAHNIVSDMCRRQRPFNSSLIGSKRADLS